MVLIANLIQVSPMTKNRPREAMIVVRVFLYYARTESTAGRRNYKLRALTTVASNTAGNEATHSELSLLALYGGETR
jgi:hypothetical protein